MWQCASILVMNLNNLSIAMSVLWFGFVSYRLPDECWRTLAGGWIALWYVFFFLCVDDVGNVGWINEQKMDGWTSFEYL